MRDDHAIVSDENVFFCKKNHLLEYSIMIYFQSPWTTPPADARFQLIPFAGGESLAFTERIHTLPAPYTRLPRHTRADLPTQAAWTPLVRRALDEKRLSKVVLARQTTLTFDEPLDALRLTAFLRERAPRATVFACALGNGSWFLGASPEQLFRRSGNRITTEAVAGTRRHALAQELLSSEKDLAEFRHVEAHLEESLAPLCGEIQRSEVSLRSAANVQHLCSETTGTLLTHTTDAELIAALHPTPAVCGAPREAAREWLKTHEPLERGYYAGLIGWSAPKSAQWTVAIRSALLEEDKLHLYAGVGLVQGSEPATEWNELEAKIGLYLD